MRTAGIVDTGTILNRSIQILGYTDDVDIIGRSVAEVREAFLKIEEVAESLGLRINEDKTKLLVASAPDSITRIIGQNIMLGENNFEMVKEYVYLGTLVNATNIIKDEVTRRAIAANRCYYGLTKQLRSKILFPQ